MRILLVANVAKEHVNKFHIPTIKALKAQGHIVDVACSGDEIVPYCDHQYHALWKRSPFNLSLIKGLLQLKKILKDVPYDVIYCHTPIGGLVARLAARSMQVENKVKVVYFAHGFHFYKGAPMLNWLLYYPVEKLLAKYTDTIITINKEDYCNAKNRLKVSNVYLLNGMGIDVQSFQMPNKQDIRKEVRRELNIPEDAFVMIYLAELIKNKNQGMLIDALKEVMKYSPNTFLILAGVDHNNGQFQRYAEKTGVGNNVRFLGWRDDKERLYAASDVCTASSIREGFGLNIVEAMASGLPVIATRNRGHETIIKNGENGFLIGINDYKSMAHCVFSVKKTGIYSNNGNIEKYDSEIIVKRLIKYVLD